jgi:hypothetical protein
VRRCHTLPAPVLTEIKTAAAEPVMDGSSMGPVIFKCPRTGINVQHWLATEPEPDHPQSSYETVVCKACSGLHFVNRSSGKLLGQRDE